MKALKNVVALVLVSVLAGCASFKLDPDNPRDPRNYDWKAIAEWPGEQIQEATTKENAVIAATLAAAALPVPAPIRAPVALGTALRHEAGKNDISEDE